MRKLKLAIFILLAGVGLAGLSSCNFNCVRGSGHQVTETRKVDDFTRIEISGGFKVNLKQDSSLNIAITADDNLLKYIKTKVEDGKLIIKTKRNLCNTSEMTLNIGIHKLEELRSSGAIEVTGDGLITTKDLNFDLSGASKITLDLNAANVTTTGSGATELYLTGQASSHHINISGVGHIHAFDFVVGDYDIETSGAGDAEINVLHNLAVHSSGASEVKYKGNPSNVTNDKSGASSVEKVN
jgi:hypothetical protein